MIEFEDKMKFDYLEKPSTSKRLKYVNVDSSSSDEDELTHGVTGQKFHIADGKFVVVEFLGKKKKKILYGKNYE